MSDVVVITQVSEQFAVITEATDGQPVVITEVSEQFVVATPGEQGMAGSGDKFYTHDQSSASALWTITHNLNKFPSVSVIDSSNREVEGLVTHVNSNSLTVTFNAAFAGTAYCN